MTSSTVSSVNTTSADPIEASGAPLASGSVEQPQSKSTSRSPGATGGLARARRSARVTLPPPDSAPPDLEAEAEALLGDKKKLYALLRKELLVAYLMECRAGKDTNANPQHSRASRKQAKELAELLARLTNDSEK